MKKIHLFAGCIVTALFLLRGGVGAMSFSPAAASVRIDNAQYQVEYQAAQGEFQILHKPSGRTFARHGRFENGCGTAAVKSVSDKTFGKGQGIEVVYSNGCADVLALYPDLPFVLFTTVLQNGTAATQTVNRVSTFSVGVESGTALEKVRTLGTGGLLAPGQNPGSYAFLSIVDPASRSGAVGGWLTHERGSGVVFSPVQDGAVRMQARVDYGCLRLKPGAQTVTETFALGWFEDARLGLEAYADAVAKVYSIKLLPQQAGHCTWYMEKNGRACNETGLVALAEVAQRELKPFGFDFILIDDYWQVGSRDNGPAKIFTTHATNGPYPNGMKAAADGLVKSGLTPGIWFMPFAGNYKEEFFKAHLDWFVKDQRGQPYDTAWGGTCLDMTNPDAQEYVRSIVQRITQQWGYKVLKMDGYWTGSATKQIYVNSGYKEDGMGDATFFNPEKTNIEALRDGTKLVRAEAGTNVFLLGCCISQNMRSFGGTFGLLDAMRVGPDTGGNIGSKHSSPVWFLNGRVWWNDPDCVMVRTKFPVERARLNATWAAIAGQLFYNSDWIPDLPAERLDILKRCMPAHGLFSRPVDVFESDIANIWLLTDTRQAVRRDVVALYNWGREEQEILCPAERVGLPAAPSYVAFDFWANRFVPPFSGSINARLPGASCRVLAVRPASPVPQLLSTSRHITQGMVDVSNEVWDASASVLSGVSKVVANDAYELRLVVPAGEKSWQAVEARVSAADEAAGVKVSFQQAGPKVRVAIRSATGREVRWQVRFKPAPVTVCAPPPVKNIQVSADYRGVRLSWTADDAEAFRIERSDGKVFTAVEPGLFDLPEKTATYRYTVTALGWTPEAKSAGVSADIRFEAITAPPLPPAPTVHLSDLPGVKTANKKGQPKPNATINGSPLKIASKIYAKGIGVFAPAQTICPVPAGATHFVAVVGVDAEAGAQATVVFKVYGDVKEMGEEPELLAESPILNTHTLKSWSFNVELNTRFKELRLVVTESDDGNDCDYGDWVDAGFILKGAH